MELVLFDGGALRSSAVELSSSSSSRIRGSVEFVKPSPAAAWRSSRSSKNKEKEVMRSPAMEVGCGGVSSQELATGDFPSAEGLHLIQAIKGCSGGGAPPAASSSSSSSGSGVFFVFLALFLGLSHGTTNSSYTFRYDTLASLPVKKEISALVEEVFVLASPIAHVGEGNEYEVSCNGWFVYLGLPAGMLHLYATKRTHRHRPPEMHTPEHVAPYLADCLKKPEERCGVRLASV